jgi:transcription termination/antitermination protein NusA
MKKETMLIDALNLVAAEKGINKEIIFEAIESSLVSACKKNFGTSQNISVKIERKSGAVTVHAKKQIVEKVIDDNLEISRDEANKIGIGLNIGDYINVVVTPKDFGRISAQTAKQVVVQKFREAEREILFKECVTKEKEVMTGIVQRVDRKNVIISLNKIDATLQQSEQIPGETFEFNSRKKVYVVEVRQSSKGPIMNISRTHAELVKRLFEQEVPEIREGIVEIKSIAREAGSRTKMAVYSKNKDIDPVGACVGINGSRVNVIVAELNGEKIDVIEYNEVLSLYISAALSPSKVVSVTVTENEQSAVIIVPDNQLSLAIGKEGQNVRLAAKLTNSKIDIKSESQAKFNGIE